MRLSAGLIVMAVLCGGAQAQSITLAAGDAETNIRRVVRFPFCHPCSVMWKPGTRLHQRTQAVYGATDPLAALNTMLEGTTLHASRGPAPHYFWIDDDQSDLPLVVVQPRQTWTITVCFKSGCFDGKRFIPRTANE